MSSNVKALKFGIDIDGVLADFTKGFLKLLAECSGGKRLLADGEEPPCWDWPQAVGYTDEEIKKAYDAIAKDHYFWANLQPMPEVNLTPVMQALFAILLGGHEIYFLTNRTGPEAHAQTLNWLVRQGITLPTILLANEIKHPDGTKEGVKGYLAKALHLTHFIDDKPENCYDVCRESPKTQVYLLSHRWNDFEEVKQQCFLRNITIVSSIREFLHHVGDSQRCPVSTT